MTKQSLLVPFCLMSFAACTDAGSSDTPAVALLKNGGVSFTMFMNGAQRREDRGLHSRQ